MEDNKENLRVRIRSRIPVPIERKLSVADHNATASKDTARDPLKTLSGHCTNQEAGPSRPLKPIDTRHVTRRRGDEDLDWNYAVFNDYKINLSIKTAEKPNININSEIMKKDVEIKTEIKAEPNSRLSLANGTPNLLRLVNTTKKFKRSLKRPHSRDLQGVSPEAKKTEQSSRYCIDGDGEVYIVTEYVVNNLQYLLSTERRCVGEPKIRSVTRACVINWIVNVNGSHGNPAIVQLACWYLDAYLTLIWVPTEKLQLTAAACFWVACKFHGLAAPASRVRRWSGHAFSTEHLVNTEATVLQVLNFPGQPIIPYDFIPYLSLCCDQTHAGLIESAAMFLCVTALMVDKGLRTEYPSVVAAAAVKSALVLLRLEEFLDKLQDIELYKIITSKTTSVSATCRRLREAVRIMTSPEYEYKGPYRKYSSSPFFVAPRITEAVNLLAVKSRARRSMGDCAY